MNRARTILGAVLLALTAGSVVEAVNSPSGIDPRLRLEWEAGRSRSGRAEISGYIYNDYGRAAINVRLLVETVDASDRVIDRAVGFVYGVVPVFNRSPFVVPVKTPGASYRITVTSFEWRDGG